MAPTFQSLHKRLPMQRGLAFGIIIIGALLAFEMFNYSTTDFALNDLLGDLRFAGMRWSTILSIAFCGIDFAGIARIFTPEQGSNEPVEVWYLFGAWLLAAAMNAILTWWGISIAVLNHETLGNAVVERATLLKVVPIFVAVLVWLSRVLLIGTFSVAGERLFTQTAHPTNHSKPRNRSYNRPATNNRPPRRQQTPAPAFRPAPKPAARPDSIYGRNEPSYHTISTGDRSNPPETRY